MYKLRGAEQVSAVTAQGHAGHQPAGGVQLLWASLDFLQFYSFFSLLFITVVAFVVFIVVVVATIIIVVIFISIIKLFLSQVLPLFSKSYYHPTNREGYE